MKMKNIKSTLSLKTKFSLKTFKAFGEKQTSQKTFARRDTLNLDKIINKSLQLFCGAFTIQLSL